MLGTPSSRHDDGMTVMMPMWDAQQMRSAADQAMRIITDQKG